MLADDCGQIAVIQRAGGIGLLPRLLRAKLWREVLDERGGFGEHKATLARVDGVVELEDDLRDGLAVDERAVFGLQIALHRL